MKMKKVLAGMLTATTLIASMSMTAWAGVEEVATSTLPNLTGINSDTLVIGDAVNYTETAIKGTDGNLYFAVSGADANWAPAYMSQSEAEDVVWSLADGSISSGVSVTYEAIEVAEGEWVSMCEVTVGASTPAGLVVPKASNTQNGYATFNILVNESGVPTPAINVQHRFYDASGTTEAYLDSATQTVVGNEYYGNSNYPSALDSPVALYFAGKVVQSYRIDSNYGTYTLKDLKINNAEYNTNDNDWTAPGWQYRVYDSTGSIKSLSADSGADNFSLSDGDIVVWKYCTYYGTSFTDSVSTTLAAE